MRVVLNKAALVSYDISDEDKRTSRHGLCENCGQSNPHRVVSSIHIRLQVSDLVTNILSDGRREHVYIYICA